VVAAEVFAARSAESQAASQAGSAFHSSPGTARSGGDYTNHQGGGGNGYGGGSSTTVAAAAALLQTAAVSSEDADAGARQGTVSFDNGTFGDTIAAGDNTLRDRAGSVDEIYAVRNDDASSDGSSSSGSNSSSAGSSEGESSVMAPVSEASAAASSVAVLTPEEVEAKARATHAATAAAVAAAPLKEVPLVVLEPWQQRLQAIDNAIKIGRANGFMQG